MATDYSKLNDLKLNTYTNSTEVCNVAGQSLTMEDVVKAALISRLNIGLLGDTGTGKTQLEKDVLGWFGNKGVYLLGRNDLDIKQVYRRFNLEKAREAKSSEEISELTAKAEHPLIVVDELNRCIEAVQNQLFNVFDGYIEIDGVKHPLGSKGYSVGIASANYGNGKFTGTSSIDRAFLDRMHLIIDTDNFQPTPLDDMNILIHSTDPRTKDAHGTDHTKTILETYQTLKQAKPSIPQLLFAEYLIHGLDYSGLPKGKRALKNVFPAVIEQSDIHDKNALYLHLIFPPSKRAVQATLSLAKGLEAIVQAKNPNAKITDDFEALTEAFKLVGAYSGILANDRIVQEEFNGNPYEAMQKVAEQVVKKRLTENKEKALAAMDYALEDGVVNEDLLSQLGKDKQAKKSKDNKPNDFGFMKKLCSDLAKQKQQ